MLGQNGAGKTTLIRMLSTSLLPTSGSARVGRARRRFRRPPRPAADRARRRRGRSFEGRLSGRENLEFFAALQRVPRDVARRRIDELLRRLDLAGSAHRLFENYSAGMRQKMAIARGLVSEPEVLFMDEPTRALDPISAREVRDLVAEYVVGELHRTVVLATHSLEEAEELCDRLVLIKTGRVIAGGTVDELRRSITAGVRCELRLSSLPEGLLETLHELPGVLALESGIDGGQPVRAAHAHRGRPGARLGAAGDRRGGRGCLRLHGARAVARGRVRRAPRLPRGSVRGAAVTAARVATAYFVRDLRVELSYRTGFLLKVGAGLMAVALFYFVARFVRNVAPTTFDEYAGTSRSSSSAWRWPPT